MTSKPVKVSVGTFLDYINLPSHRRTAATRAAITMYGTDSDFEQRDFYLGIKHAVRASANLRGDVTPLGRAVRRADPKKREHFEAIAAGCESYISKKRSVEPFAVASDVWTSGDLTVTVSPEVAVRINGKPFVFKLYFKEPVLTKRVVDPALRILERTHGHLGTVGFFDLRRGKPIVPTRPVPHIDALLDAEAMSFVTLWRKLAA